MGRPTSDPRLMLNWLLWILRTGSPWRNLPELFGPSQNVYDHFARWSKPGVYGRSFEALHIRLDADGEIDWDLWCIDNSSGRASRAAAGAAEKAAVGTRTSRKIMRWAAREADSPAGSSCLLTVEACRCRSKSPPDRCMTRPASSR
jgi:transposase